MSNLSVRKIIGNVPTIPLSMDWSPFRLMRDELDVKPFWAGPALGQAAERHFLPVFDIIEAKDCYLIKTDVPGVKAEDIDITITGNGLFITGRRELEEEFKEGTFHLIERKFGRFRRGFALPDGVVSENVIAALKDGVLTVKIPKRLDAPSRKVLINEALPSSS